MHQRRSLTANRRGEAENLDRLPRRGKCKEDAQRIVQSLCTLINGDDDLRCFFAGSTLDLFSREMIGGLYNYIPIPLLTFTSSLRLVQSFVGRSNPSEPLRKIATKLVRLSGGHPKTIQLFETVVKEKSTIEWSDDNMLRTAVDSSFAKLPLFLSEAEIVLLLRPRFRSTERDLKRALEGEK